MKVDENFEVKDNEFLRQFETRIEGKFVTLEYSAQPRQIFLTKFVMDDSLKKRGFDQKFLKAIFDKLSDDRKRVVPTCPQVTQFFKAHKREYRELLPTGLNI